MDLADDPKEARDIESSIETLERDMNKLTIRSDQRQQPQGDSLVPTLSEDESMKTLISVDLAVNCCTLIMELLLVWVEQQQ